MACALVGVKDFRKIYVGVGQKNLILEGVSVMGRVNFCRERGGGGGGDYNPTKRRILIVFDDMIAGIMTNKNFQAIIKAITIY